MEEAKGLVKHAMLVKFKDEISPEQIQQLIKAAAQLQNRVPQIKGFCWGTELSIVNMEQGFSHIFEVSFESTEGYLEYMAHPARAEYGNLLVPSVEKAIVFDYKPTFVRL